MLRIEKVFLQGFKSFNDPTELVFDADGITAVVGPNGCGKSNVADALSWVIGEQRAKALRGGKMEDVIFQGSRNRKPSGLAEVILTMRVYESFEIRSQEKESVSVSAAAPNVDTIAAASELAAAPPPEQALPKERQESALPHQFPALKSTSRVFQEGERITVARRLYRTGESEYEMNGRTCRLRDIQDLFAGTGLGGAHYAIIEQGRIGQVLSAKPLDRRALIEEAAGISKFKMRQRTSELKLEAAKQNLSRVTDIIAEVERQQSSLKRQAGKARRYQRLRHEMRELMKAVYVTDYRTTRQTVDELAVNKQRFSQEEMSCLAAIAQTELARQVTVTQVETIDATLTQAREAAAQTNLQLEKARQQEIYLREQISSLQKRTAQFSQEQAAIGEREEMTARELARLRAELITLEAEINTQANALSQAEAIYLQASTRDDQIEKDLEHLQRRVTEAATQQERWKQLVQQFTDAVERAQRALNGLSLEQQRATEQVIKNEEELTVIALRIQTLDQQQDDLLQQQATFREMLRQKHAEAEGLNQTLAALQQRFTTTDQRLKSLLELEEKRAYFSEPVQAIIQASQKAGSKSFNITSTLADLVKVKSQDEALVEVGLTEELQYLITPSFEDALRAIDFLKEEQLGRATFLVLDVNPLPVSEGAERETGSAIVRLIDLLGLKPSLRKLIQQALPRLSQTLIAQEIHQAISESIHTNGKGNSFLTPSGELISAGHVITGGSSTAQGTGILALKREIETLRLEVAELLEELATATERRDTLRTALQEIQSQSSVVENELRGLEKSLVLQQGLQQQGQREAERTSAHVRVVEKEITQAQQELAEATAKLTQAEAALQQARATLITTENAAQVAQGDILEIRRQATERTRELSSRRADYTAKSERRKGLQSDIKRLEAETQEISRRLNRAQMEALEVEETSQQRSASLAQLGEEIATLHAQWQEQAGQVEFFQVQATEKKELLVKHETELSRLRADASSWRESRAEIDLTQAKLTAHLEHLASACQLELAESITDLLTKYEASLAGAEEPSPTTPLQAGEGETEEFEGEEPVLSFHYLSEDFELEQAKTQLQELRSKVEGLGPVNLLALEELGAADERLTFLLEQKADIEQAVSDTLAVITELKRRSRDRFVDAFHQINQNFSTMFLELFGGGHGEMRLIDETDVLESGIDIIAQPPGKRLQNVLLLSGGEKAMAALALIMGIFKYRPSPFCLLDEVDAPLDDVNIGRFADKVLEMSQNTQFLVITHSKRTMEAAKTMYGVTMEDPGVSKLISVRLT